MCTIGAKKINGIFYLLKTRDPVPGWMFEDEVKLFDDNIKKLIVCNKDGMYGGVNQKGVGIVGTYVKIKEGQSAYFDDNHIRMVLDSNTAQKALNFIKNFKPTMGGNIILADKRRCFWL
ncbi:MAG: hypothetical protein QXY45_03635 [Candidatus Aenigmatarchaeota archaeon]